jgi:hypothetical protein
LSNYPNVPLQRGEDFDRKVAQAVNHLLNEQGYIIIEVDGVPDAGQELLNRQFPVPVQIVANDCGLKADVATTNAASFAVTIGGASAGTINLAATATLASFSLSVTEVPAWTRLRITAPNPQDPTLADFTLALAINC